MQIKSLQIVPLRDLVFNLKQIIIAASTYVCNLVNVSTAISRSGECGGLISSPNCLVRIDESDCRVGKFILNVIVFDIGPPTRQIRLYGRLDTFSSC